jgi:flagellar basal body-associated protein FliL
MAAVTDVNCVEGCGDSLAIVMVAIVSLIVSFVAAVLAYKAWRTSVEQRNMQEVEHDALLDQLSAVALLDVEMHLLSDDSRDRQVDAGVIYKILAIDGGFWVQLARPGTFVLV